MYCDQPVVLVVIDVGHHVGHHIEDGHDCPQEGHLTDGHHGILRQGGTASSPSPSQREVEDGGV